MPNAASPGSRYHDRRASARRSFTSTPLSDSPRTLCPRDSDAFSYDPSYLSYWNVPQQLWERLPSTVQAPIAAVQHAGAAVLTGAPFSVHSAFYIVLT